VAGLGCVKFMDYQPHPIGHYDTAMEFSSDPPALHATRISVRFWPNLEPASPACCVGTVGWKKMGTKSGDRLCYSLWTILLVGTMAVEKQSTEEYKLAIFIGSYPDIIGSRLVDSIP